MIRNLKMLGLALVAVFAMSAMVASAASAADVFTSESEKTDLTGTTESGVKPVLQLGAGGTEVICEDTSYTGTATKKISTEITVHPVYNGPCEIKGFGKVTGVDTDGCDYILTGTTDKVGTETHATVSVECTAGKDIVITTGLGINLHVAAQGPLLGVVYSAGPEENKLDTVTINATVKGITYTCTGAFCGLLANNGNGNNAIYTDKVIATGFKDEGTFSQNATTHVWSGTHGAQVGITVSEGT